MSAHQAMRPREEILSLDQLYAILARYRPDDDSWPCGLANLWRAVRAKVAAAKEAR
jgi:hypothetical protein